MTVHTSKSDMPGLKAPHMDTRYACMKMTIMSTWRWSSCRMFAVTTLHCHLKEKHAAAWQVCGGTVGREQSNKNRGSLTNPSHWCSLLSFVNQVPWDSLSACGCLQICSPVNVSVERTLVGIEQGRLSCDVVRLTPLALQPASPGPLVRVERTLGMLLRVQHVALVRGCRSVVFVK